MIYKIIFFFLWSAQVLAASMEPTFPAPDIRTQGKPYPEYNMPTAEQMEAEANPTKPVWPWSMPFLAQNVIDKGFKLPRPYGVGLVFYHQVQAINISDLSVGFTDNDALHPIDFIDFGGSKVENTTWQLKLDSWILPFLDLFGIVGAIQGTGQVPISISSKDLYEFFIPGICSGGAAPQFCNGYVSATAPIDYYGNNVGIGVLVAGGYKNFFFAMPATYVVTNINVSDTNINVINVTPRLGYAYSTAFSGKFGLYVGANYLEAKGYLTGKYTLPMSGTAIGHDVTVRYSLQENPIDKWNSIFGMNWELSDLWSIAAEIGLSKNRTSQTFNFGYRF